MGDALERVLTTALAQADPQITARRHLLLAPLPANPTLTIFLYDVAEDFTMRNSLPMTRLENDRWLAKRAPTPMILRYMLTPWASQPSDVEKMLGCVLSTLQDSRTLSGDKLDPSFSGSPNPVGLTDVELLSVSLGQLTLEEKAKVWWAIQQPFHVSLIYEVRVVQIDPFEEAAGIVGGSVKQRRLEGAVPVGGER